MTGRGLVVLALAGAVAWLTFTPEGRAAVTPPPAGRAPAPGAAACPVSGARISSGYGPRAGGFHDGVDLAAPIGTPIRAVLGGVVTHSGDDDPAGYGSYIDVTSSAGRQQYGHESRRLVKAGQRVKAGQVIALVGDRGEATGPHLHLRVYLPGARSGTDPAPWLAGHGVHLPCR